MHFCDAPIMFKVYDDDEMDGNTDEKDKPEKLGKVRHKMLLH